MRLIAMLLVGLTLIGCSGGTTSNATASISETNALKVARQWVIEQGIDPASSELSVDADGTGWSALIEYQPPAPGAHALLQIDSQGKIIEVNPGAQQVAELTRRSFGRFGVFRAQCLYFA